MSVDDSTNGWLDAIPKEMLQEASNMEIERLKDELATLAMHVNVFDLKLQTLMKQIVMESTDVQELSNEVISSKAEKRCT